MKKFIFFFIKIIFNFFERIFFYLRLIFYKKYNFSVTKGFNQSNKVVLIATFIKGDMICQNLIQLLKVFKSKKFLIILVNDGYINLTNKEILSEYCFIISDRKALGADFASYKFGIDIINKKKIKFDKLIICNDSCFYIKNKFEKILDIINEQDFDVLGLTENFKPLYHIQSFFFAINNNVFNNYEFKSFWKNYIPLKNKNHRINNGEINLTQKVFKNFDIKILFNEHDVIELIQKHISRNSEFKNFLNTYYKQKNFDISFYNYLENFKNNKDIKLRDKNFFSYNLSKEQDGNLMNIFGLYLILIDEINFPLIKKDLIYTGQFSFLELEYIIDNSNLNYEFKKMILNHYRSTDSIKWLSFSSLIFDHFSLLRLKKIILKNIEF